MLYGNAMNEYWLKFRVKSTKFTKVFKKESARFSIGQHIDLNDTPLVGRRWGDDEMTLQDVGLR